MVDSPTRVNPDPRRALPSVSRLAGRLAAARPDLPGWAVTEGARQVVATARGMLTRAMEREGLDSPGSPQEPEESDPAWEARASAVAERLGRAHPRPVVNATGVVLHTNLGRSPLPEGAAEAVHRVAVAYSNLELDLETGRRGSRLGALEVKLCELSGAEGAYACNNNAAAVLLGLDTLARGREVIVSRGELVEIGGSFRIPDIMERSGARLVEVGTTNRTHARDYERAIGANTALLLKVHRSNFSQSGFVAEVELSDLVAIGRRHDVPVMEDLGSGTLLDLSDRGFPPEAFAPSRVATGADLVCFSGDKLLGGPQAGILLGSRAAIDAVRENPLARALRLDKMSLAALDWTLSAYLEGRAASEIPVVRQLLEPVGEIEVRARALADRVAELVKDSVEVGVEPDRAPVGGGSLPGFELDTWVVTLRTPKGASGVAAALRAASTPVLTRVRDDAVIFDLRTAGDGDVSLIETAIAEMLV
jgi:L-seryl-tRNA(Ser) seleniumtransferase